MQNKYIWVCNLCGTIMHTEEERRKHKAKKCTEKLIENSPSMSIKEFSKRKYKFSVHE